MSYRPTRSDRHLGVIMALEVPKIPEGRRVGGYRPGPPAVKITIKATIRAKMMAIIPLTVRLTYINA